MQFNTGTSDVSIKVDDVILENVAEFCYLGHTIFNDVRNSTEQRIAKVTSKFHELGDVLRNHEIDPSIHR